MTLVLQDFNAIFTIEKIDSSFSLYNIKEIYFDEMYNEKILLNLNVRVPIKYLNNNMIIKCDKHFIKGIIQINNISYYDWIKDIVDEKEFDFIYKSSKKLIKKKYY